MSDIYQEFGGRVTTEFIEQKWRDSFLRGFDLGIMRDDVRLTKILKLPWNDAESYATKVCMFDVRVWCVGGSSKDYLHREFVTFTLNDKPTVVDGRIYQLGVSVRNYCKMHYEMSRMPE